MGTITQILTGIGGSQKKAHDILTQWVGDKAVVQVELEGSAARFRSRLLMSEDSIILAKPAELNAKGLAAGVMLRVKGPDDATRELRLEVSAPHVNMSSGNAVIVCRLNNAAVVRTKRKSRRYDVSNRNGVRLVIPQRGREFQLSDISDAGCSVATSRMEAETYFPLGDTLHNVRILAGTKTSIEIAALVPRAHKARSVGFAFTLKEDPQSKNNLSRIIQVLETPA
ncbi:MAG TPA: PilZ domain-containing protein [bacterium]